MIQEVISLLVFTMVVSVMFENEALKWNHLAAVFCLIGAVCFVFKK